MKESPTHCLLQPNSIAEPLRFTEIFDPHRPVEIDLGCGKGRFLLARAEANPSIQYLGVERLLLRVRKIDRKVHRLKLDNVRLLRLEVSYVLEHMLPMHVIDRAYLLFPDPWPKRRHHKRRLVNRHFRDQLWRCLVPGGEVQIATDHLDYFEDIRRQFSDDSRFAASEPMVRTPEEQTDFELIFRGQGLSIGACAFRSLPADSSGVVVEPHPATGDA